MDALIPKSSWLLAGFTQILGFRHPKALRAFCDDVLGLKGEKEKCGSECEIPHLPTFCLSFLDVGRQLGE